MAHLVLVVEDDPQIRKGLVTLLRSDGHSAVAAATVAEATDQLNTATPTHLLLDLNLPDGPGTQVLRHVRGGAMPVRVALVTGGCDAELAAEAQALGVEAVFVKPADWDKLLNWVAAP